MVFSGLTFLYFYLPIVLGAYFLTPKRFKNLTLAVSSLFFYAWGEPVYVLIMLFSVAFNYGVGLHIERAENKKTVLVCSVAANLLILCAFKYTNFLIDNANVLPFINIPAVNITLPIGISFYTFQAMSYVIDVYRGDVKATKSIVDFTAYVSLFPQLIAGPIVRYSTISEQLKERFVTTDGIYDGVMRFICGLSKKVIFANSIGMLWTSISSMENIGWQTAWLGIIAFSLQIYFDFSGYSDMAIGLGKILGFDFLENFNYPYIAKSITDFWRRWHISLSTWFRDYVYISLGGNRVKLSRNCLNILIVWSLTGLWHGASWNFIIWGIYYGVLLLLEKFVFGKIIDKLPSLLRRAYTLLAVIIGWVFFSAQDIGGALEFIKTMFSFNLIKDNVFLYNISSYLPLLIAMFIGCTPLPKRIADKCGYLKPFFCIIALLVCTAYLVDSTYNPFLYFRF